VTPVTRLLWLPIILFLLGGCATPIGVTWMNGQDSYRLLTTSILSSDQPSPFSMQFLQRFALVEQYRKDPQGTIATLHAGLGGPDEPGRLFALSELSFAHARRQRDKASFLAAAFYAYAFLFPENSTQQPSPYDPRLRLAIELYNRGVANGLRAEKGRKLDLQPRTMALPNGSMRIDFDCPEKTYGGYRLENFIPTTDLRVRGLRNRYRNPGLGAALTAQVEKTAEQAPSRWIPPNAKVPVTIFMRFSSPQRAFSEHSGTATIELYDVDETPTTQVGSYTVPLEFDATAALAYRLEGSAIWDTEIAGFRGIKLNVFEKQAEGRLFFLNPYRPGRIPVVFVHGTASSPARWAEMINELLTDPGIASRYQFWVYMYNTGNPVALSAMYLRESLDSALKEIDPAGQDPALREMVVMGHSQGGLLTKMTVVDSGNQFWGKVRKDSFEDAPLSPETRDLLRRSLFVKPLPCVKRVIFLSTPHRGSFLAENLIGKIGRKLINLPSNMTKVGLQLASLDPAGAARTTWRMPTSLDNMDWSNPFLRTLQSLPIAQGVHVNSIVAVKKEGPPEGQDDGVVRYTSAHLEKSESELIVRSGHSSQSDPHAIEEVRRILYEHAGIARTTPPVQDPDSTEPAIH
jgi:pimeloyl-ACP methyl ester carboxylesterase